MKVVVVTVDEDGNVKITRDELDKMLNKAYESGFENGKNSVKDATNMPSITPLTPGTPAPWMPNSPYYPTCLYCSPSVSCDLNNKGV